jgi:hypothetical protein
MHAQGNWSLPSYNQDKEAGLQRQLVTGAQPAAAGCPMGAMAVAVIRVFPPLVDLLSHGAVLAGYVFAYPTRHGRVLLFFGPS